MQAGGGDDFVQVDNFGEVASVSVHGGAGTDMLSFFTSGTGVVVSLGAVGTQAATDVLSVSMERFENLGGSQFSDVLEGDDSTNVLYGDAGNDRLYGGGSDDHLFGDQSLQPHVENGAGRNGFEAVEADGARDCLYGGDGNDVLEGGGYRDRMTGGSGVDTLLGGSGSDVFTFKNVADSGVGEGNRDLMDFAHSNWERLDLWRIDADVNTADDQAFFLGGSAFTNVAGELVQFVEGGHTVLAGDVDGDGVADFELEMMSDAVLVTEDFWL
jgi:serralysin